MKQLFLSLTAVALSFGAFAQQKSSDIALFKTDVVDLGRIPQGTPAPATFSVRNVGKTPLLIENVQPTCGCTAGDYTKEPIAVGNEGKVTATYNAAAMGYFTKTIKVKFAGFDDLRDLTIKGEVVSAEEFKSANPSLVKKEEVEIKKDGAEVKTKTTTVTPASNGAVIKTKKKTKTVKKAA